MATIYTIEGREINGETMIRDWVSSGINKDAVNFAERFGDDLANMKMGRADESLTTAQIRNVFGEVRRIQMAIKKDYQEAPILLLRPKLAYSAKRANRRAVRDLANVLSEGIKAVVDGASDEDKKTRFENFANFFEAVLAYHKAKGGK